MLVETSAVLMYKLEKCFWCFQASKKYFMGTFLGSILWIAMFSYLMLWWAHQVRAELS